MDEVMFLQGNVEEKIGTLRLGGELANIAKTKAETDLIADQEALVAKQTLTEVQNALKVVAETSLLGEQEALVEVQALDVAADTTLKGKQGSLVDAQATDVAADTTLKGKQGSLVDAQATDVAADTTLKGKQGSLVDAQATDVAADTTLKGKQGSLVDAQATDVAADTTLKGLQGTLLGAQTTDVGADTVLKGKQGALVDAQELKTDAETTLTSNQSSLVASQKTQLDAQTAIEATAEKAFYDGVVAGTQDTYRDFAAEMRIMGVQESTFQQTPAYKKIEMLKDAAKLRLVTATETGTDATELLEVNKVMRFIGEPPVTALNDNSLASECVRLLRDTDTELQGRGWWFNIEEDVELTPNPANNTILIPSSMLSLEINNYDTRIITIVSSRFLYDLSKKSFESWTSAIKAKSILKRTLIDTPQKYREYLSVRVAILLTELYPQSGVDIQRLPKMEAELRAYFKDREFDDANYSIFDSYDVATRIGINRNYDLI
jgi:hypothetical protein